MHDRADTVLRRMMCMREEKKPVPVRRVYTPRGERLEQLMVRYLADRHG